MFAGALLSATLASSAENVPHGSRFAIQLVLDCRVLYQMFPHPIFVKTIEELRTKTDSVEWSLLNEPLAKNARIAIARCSVCRWWPFLSAKQPPIEDFIRPAASRRDKSAEGIERRGDDIIRRGLKRVTVDRHYATPRRRSKAADNPTPHQAAGWRRASHLSISTRRPRLVAGGTKSSTRARIYEPRKRRVQAAGKFYSRRFSRLFYAGQVVGEA